MRRLYFKAVRHVVILFPVALHACHHRHSIATVDVLRADETYTLEAVIRTDRLRRLRRIRAEDVQSVLFLLQRRNLRRLLERA